MRKTYSIRLEPGLIEKAKSLGLDVNSIIEKQLRKVARAEKCPTCGHRHTKPTEDPQKL